MNTLYGPKMVDGLMAPAIDMVPIYGGTFHVGPRSGPITLSSFQMGVNSVTNGQYGSIAGQLGAARYFAMANDPVTRRPTLIARGDDPERLRAMDAGELFTGLHEAGMAVTEQDWSVLPEGFKVFMVGEHQPSDGFDRPNQPAVMVSWYGAFVFADLLGMMNGDGCSLPTDFQWEWAAKGSSDRRYATLRGELHQKVAHYSGYDDNSVAATIDVDDPRFPSMENGLRHMSGNVWEWVLNWHGNPPLNAVMDPIGHESGSQKSLRGGSWNETLEGNMSAVFKSPARPNYFSYDVGFRVMATALRDSI